MSEIELRDAILRHSLQLMRLSAHEQSEAEAILRELEAELKQLLNSNVLSEAGKAEINALIAEADKAIDAKYATLSTSVDTHGIAVIVAEKTVAVMGEAFPVMAPTPERLASLTRNVLIEGSPLSEWWKAQAADTAGKFAAQVRLGVIAGETNEAIARRIAGGRGEVGIMAVARRHARTLVQSSVQAAANEARLATYRKNAKLIAGLRWLATLDSHTCVRCGAMDGAAWDLEGERKRGTSVAFTVPPLHVSCRCVLTPIPKSFADLGLDIKEPGEGTRASAEGPVSSTTTFEDFLERQPASFVERTLGKRRAQLFLEGKLTLRDLISGTGRELTLGELEKHI